MKLFEVYSLYPIAPIYAKGVYVYDKNDTAYLDFYGGHAVISIGHSHPNYVKALQEQVSRIGFYSNAVENPLQIELAEKLGKLSKCDTYQLFLCNSGAEANENAIKLASFVTQREEIVAFTNGFHGRTSAAVAATDNPSIVAPINASHKVTFVDFNDVDRLEEVLSEKKICAVIIECIQGVGGLYEANQEFYREVSNLCKKYRTLLIADEVQSGFGRTGDFFAFQKYGWQPDIISMAKGMGNGFPIGGILIHPWIKPKKAMLGTTFGGNHLACRACISVLDVLKQENLIQKVEEKADYFKKQAEKIPQIKQIRGRGLMLGFVFDFEIANLRKQLLFEKHIFTGAASDKNILRILPPLTIEKEHIDYFFTSLKEVLQP